VLPPSPRARGPPWADTPWDRGFLVTPPGTRWPGTQATFLRFMVRAGGPLRTRARNPGPYRLLRGPGCYASPASLVRNSRLEKRSVVAAPASPMRRLPRLCRKTSWLESQGEKYTPGWRHQTRRVAAGRSRLSRRPAVSKTSATWRTFFILLTPTQTPGVTPDNASPARRLCDFPSPALLRHRRRAGRISARLRRTVR
jgi:hypothetical protein